MTLQNRVGYFLLFCGGLTLLYFWASLNSSDKRYEFVALLAGAGLVAVGWVLRGARKRAEPEETPAPSKKPRPGRLAGLFRKPEAAPTKNGQGGAPRSKPKKS